MKIILAADELGVGQIRSRIETPESFRTMAITYCRGYSPRSSSANVYERGHIVGVALDEFIKEPRVKQDPSRGIGPNAPALKANFLSYSRKLVHIPHTTGHTSGQRQVKRRLKVQNLDSAA
jgi:hypothetical protein